MNWFDMLLVLVILASVASGLRTGLARVVVHLAATIVGLLAGFWLYKTVAIYVDPDLHNSTQDQLVGFAIPFFAVLTLGSLVGMLLSRLVQWIGLGWFDHLMGGFAGALRGALLIAASLAMLIAFAPSPLPPFLTESRVIPYAAQVSAVLAEMAPSGLRQEFHRQIQKLKQYWPDQPSKNERYV